MGICPTSSSVCLGQTLIRCILLWVLVHTYLHCKCLPLKCTGKISQTLQVLVSSPLKKGWLMIFATWLPCPFPVPFLLRIEWTCLWQGSLLKLQAGREFWRLYKQRAGLSHGHGNMPHGWSQRSRFDQQALNKLLTTSPETVSCLQPLKWDALLACNIKCMYFLEMTKAIAFLQNAFLLRCTAAKSLPPLCDLQKG